MSADPKRLSERLSKWEAAALAALGRKETKLYNFEDGSGRALIIDPTANRFFIVQNGAWVYAHR